MVDSSIFEEARGVLEALAGQDCGPALAWCGVHGTRLRKTRSCLEFQLRVQVRHTQCHVEFGLHSMQYASHVCIKETTGICMK